MSSNDSAGNSQKQRNERRVQLTEPTREAIARIQKHLRDHGLASAPEWLRKMASHGEHDPFGNAKVVEYAMHLLESVLTGETRTEFFLGINREFEGENP